MRKLSDTMLMQLFTNLIRNAVKYSPSDPAIIEINGEITDDSVVCTIQDNGIGIDMNTPAAYLSYSAVQTMFKI